MEDNFDSNQSGNRIIKSIIHFFIKMINIIFMCKIAKKSSKKAPKKSKFTTKKNAQKGPKILRLATEEEKNVPKQG